MAHMYVPSTIELTQSESDSGFGSELDQSHHSIWDELESVSSDSETFRHEHGRR